MTPLCNDYHSAVGRGEYKLVPEDTACSCSLEITTHLLVQVAVAAAPEAEGWKRGNHGKKGKDPVGGSLVRQSVCQHRGGSQEGPRKLLSKQVPHNHEFYQNVRGTLKTRSGSKIQPSL